MSEYSRNDLQKQLRFGDFFDYITLVIGII